MHTSFWTIDFTNVLLKEIEEISRFNTLPEIVFVRDDHLRLLNVIVQV